MSTDTVPWWVPEIGPREYELVKGVLDSNYLNDGEVTERFERKIAELLGVKYVVAVTSGTAAIALALAGLGIGAGDEVIVPDLTFIATANAVTLTGATPVLVDIDPATLTVDMEAVAAAVTPRTRAIVPVHVSGRAAAIDALLELSRRSGIYIVEDAAEAFMSRYGSGYLGTLGHAGCLSFSPNKTITTGQGGAVLTNDDRLHVRLRELKDQGRPVRGTGGDDVHASVGYNFKLTNLQAAVGLAQLEYLGARLNRMRSIFTFYATQLRGLAGLHLPGFQLHRGESPQWTDAIVQRRDELDRYLLDHGVHCRRFWFPLHTQAPYRRPDEKFPNSTAVAPQAIWFPSAFTLSDADLSTTCHHVRSFFRECNVTGRIEKTA